MKTGAGDETSRSSGSFLKDAINYGRQFGLSPSELKELANIFSNATSEDSKKETLNKLINIIKEPENKLKEMRQSILMPSITKINEDHHKSCSDEVKMAKMQLKSIINDSEEIIRQLDNCEELDAWVQSKLALAEDYISTVQKYLKYEEEEVPAVLPLIPADDTEGYDMLQIGDSPVDFPTDFPEADPAESPEDLYMPSMADVEDEEEMESDLFSKEDLDLFDDDEI
jgi:hypothetical protein